MEENNQENINLKAMWQQLWSRRKLFIRNCAIAFIAACIWILPLPRKFEASVILAPETTSASSATSGLSGLAASFGINLGKARVVDAIYPTIYPNVMESKDFIVGLLDVTITTSDPDEPLTTTYYDYLVHHQKHAIWFQPFRWMTKKVRTVIKRIKGEPLDDEDAEGPVTIDPFRLTSSQERLIEAVHKRVMCDIEDKTCIITLVVHDQDPLVAATMADSAQARLQRFITNYKTGKARIDMEYYANLCEQSRKEYEESLEAYSRFLDTHVDATLQSTLSMSEHLHNETQIKQTSYTSFVAQYEAARAKVQENTPAFTTLQSPSVPNKAIAPRRSRFVLIVTFLTGLFTACYLLRKELSLIMASTFRRKHYDDDDEDF